MPLIRDLLAGVLDNYSRDNSAEVNNQLRTWLSNESKRIKPLLPYGDTLIKSSLGSGSFAEVPWIGFRLPRLAPNFRSGIYVVYLFSGANRTVALCLAQGVTNVAEQRPGLPNPSSKDFPELERRALAIRSLIDPPEQFDLDELHLSVQSIRGRAYEHSFICGRLYHRDGLPEESTLESDLVAMLQVYQSITTDFSADTSATVSQYERVQPLPERKYQRGRSADGKVDVTKSIDTEAWRQAIERRKRSHQAVLDRVAAAADGSFQSE